MWASVPTRRADRVVGPYNPSDKSIGLNRCYIVATEQVRMVNLLDNISRRS